MSNQDTKIQELQAQIQKLEQAIGETKTRESKGIGKYVMENLRAGTWEGKSNKEIATEVSEKFKSETTDKCIAWYKNKLKQIMKDELAKAVEELAKLQS